MRARVQTTEMADIQVYYANIRYTCDIGIISDTGCILYYTAHGNAVEKLHNVIYCLRQTHKRKGLFEQFVTTRKCNMGLCVRSASDQIP